MHPAGVRDAVRGNLRLVLSAPDGGPAGPGDADGTVPEPGGWNRFSIEVADLAAMVSELRARACVPQ